MGHSDEAGNLGRMPGPSSSEPDLTIDQLAAAVGLTVRTVRSYTTRGLLPPPKLRGRTGLYGSEHLARLSVIREMLDSGYSLAAAEQVLATAPSGLSAPGLSVFRALLSPTDEEAPEIVDRQVLAARMHHDLDDDMVAQLESLELVRPLPDGRLELLSPMLIQAGLQLASLGIGMDRVLDATEDLTRHAQAMADVCVQLFRQDVWQPFVAAGAPEQGWPEVRDALDRALPVASQAVLVIFRRALAAAISQALTQAREHGEGVYAAGERTTRP
jgi:DNA-binding transcriptional MerR regulator